LKNHRRPQQSGFTAGRSTTDAILTLRLLSELHWEFDRPLHVAYVDLKSAFDSVDRQALWKAFRGINMPQVLLKLTEDLHTGKTSQVSLGGLMSDSFSTSSGVHQGCILAPAIFCRATDWTMERTAREAGAHVGNNLYSDLDYADDVMLMAERTETLRSAIAKFYQTAEDLGLTYRGRKLKYRTWVLVILLHT